MFEINFRESSLEDSRNKIADFIRHHHEEDGDVGIVLDTYSGLELYVDKLCSMLNGENIVRSNNDVRINNVNIFTSVNGDSLIGQIYGIVVMSRIDPRILTNISCFKEVNAYVV